MISLSKIPATCLPNRVSPVALAVAQQIVHRQVKIRMEEMHLKQVDLIIEIGGKSRVSEILNKKRKLTLEMIRNLTVKLNLSAELLIRDYQLVE